MTLQLTSYKSRLCESSRLNTFLVWPHPEYSYINPSLSRHIVLSCLRNRFLFAPTGSRTCARVNGGRSANQYATSPDIYRRERSGCKAFECVLKSTMIMWRRSVNGAYCCRTQSKWRIILIGLSGNWSISLLWQQVGLMWDNKPENYS
jgi:hypothetical protein